MPGRMSMSLLLIFKEKTAEELLGTSFNKNIIVSLREGVFHVPVDLFITYYLRLQKGMADLLKFTGIFF